MEISTNTNSMKTVYIVIFAVMAVVVQLASGQPTMQNSYWKHHLDLSNHRHHNNKNNNEKETNPFRSAGNIRITSASDGSSVEIQRSLDAVLLELQRRGSDADTMRNDMGDLQRRHDDSRRLLLQLTESVNILVKELLKTPTQPATITKCDCSGLGVRNDISNDGEGGETDNRGGEKGGGGSESENTRERRRDGGSSLAHLEGYVSSGDPSSNHLPDANTNTHHPHTSDDNNQINYRGGKISDFDEEDDDFYEHSEDDGKGVEPSTTTTTTAETTTTPDPILGLYNGTIPKDCDDLRRMGYSRNGTYVIRPAMAERSFRVLCEFHESDPQQPQGQPTSWTLIQRRLDGSEDFYRTWQEYKQGFGDLRGEFWLGNEKIYRLTNQDHYRLRIDMWEWPRVLTSSSSSSSSSSSASRFVGEPVSRYYFAESNSFFIDNETYRYELHVPSDYFAYTGFGGSGLRIHAGPFLTHDVDFEDPPPGMRENCAEKFHCGWWFTTCVRNANFNGLYYKGGYKDEKKKKRARDDIYWPNIDQSLYKVVMKVGRVSESYVLRTGK